ncbi:MAG TPA: hypothetical protein VF681_02715 [Abditibacteriaceae bacterium]|jgi:hypothetical protein
MNEPDYAQYTLEELQDTLRHIDAVRHPLRYARLVDELQRRESEPTPTHRAEAARVKRKQLFAQWGGIGGIAGAFSLPFSLAFLQLLLRTNQTQGSAFVLDPLMFWGGAPLGWLLGVAGGVWWATLRVRQEELELNALEVWRDSVAATVSLWFGGCLISPFIFIILALLLGFLFVFLLWLRDLMF